MTAAVIITFLSPLGFVLIGALAGVIMIAQMTFLAEVHDHQGLVMGLFSTSSYLGMTILPVVAGFIADACRFPGRFLFRSHMCGIGRRNDRLVRLSRVSCGKMTVIWAVKQYIHLP